MSVKLKPISTAWSLLIFGLASFILFLQTRYLIPFLSRRTGFEPVVFWLIVAGLAMFLPLLLVACYILKKEGWSLDSSMWTKRLRFSKLTRVDWLQCLGAIIVIGILSFSIMKITEAVTGPMDSNPPFMKFEPLTAGRYWILLLWIVYWPLNIMGEEILWRGVLLPRQEIRYGKTTWIFHAIFWSIFHISFGWKLMLTMLPILFILPYIVQKQKNSWIGVIIHAVINGPSFIAIAFGVL